jgi:ribosomal subunit interface protein
MDVSEALLADIEEKAEKLDRFSDHIMACRVVVDAPHQHHHQGSLYRISIDVTIPGGEVVASRTADEHHAHEDVYVAVRDAFNAIKRQLEDRVREQRHKVKQHIPPSHGKVERLNGDEGFGFITTADGREVYFHRNSVLHDGFDRLEIGSEVRFHEEEGEEGPQASSVALIGKHHIVETAAQ